MPKFCNQCGSPLNVGTRFCTNCGASVAEAAAPQNPTPERPQQTYQQPYQQPQAQPQQPQQPKQRVPIDTDPEVKSEGMDWNQFKPKLTIGKPQVTFISKRKLIIFGIIFLIFVLLALLQSCGTLKKTDGTTTKHKSISSVSTVGKYNPYK